ncbi:type IV pilus biogenesis protein PilM [Bacillus rubiinfantis]|uniref:type IV pilus biogenesis protein PilM n=1 Tax=Bacillus rubiinfantis TaxID=1499680 RepID=UPI0005A6D9DA|nr:pilus assembly protein PilM [Bacillus rubiinfantis]
MAINFMLGKRKIVNFTIKDHAIRFVELKQTYPLVIQKMGEYYLPNGLIKEGKILDYDTLATITEQCVAEWKISKRQVRFIVPDPFIVIRKVPIPKDIQEDEIRGYLYMELGSSIHLPFEDPVFDFYLLDGVKDGAEESLKEILLFAAPENMVKEYMDLLEEAKLRPIAADISSLAMNRLIYQHAASISSNDPYLIVQIDLQSINICIFEDNIPVIMRNLYMDIDREKWNYKEKMNTYLTFDFIGEKQEVLNALKDMYSEIEKVLNFYQYSLKQGKKQVQTVYVDGDHPWLDEICKQLKGRFEIPVIKIEDFLKKQLGTELIPPQFHLNMGLGLKEV